MKDYLQNKLAMKLQFFANSKDDPKDPEGAEGQEGGTEGDDSKPIVFNTQEELDNLIEGRVAKTRKSLKKEFDDSLADEVKKALSKEKDLSKLSKEDREKAELEEEKTKLAKQQRDLALQGQRYQAIDELQERGLSKSFVDYLVTENAEKTLENIKTFETEFNAAVDAKVEEQVSEALKGKAPGRKGNKGNMVNPFAKDTFNLTEQGRLLKENPELYASLKAQVNN